MKLTMCALLALAVSSAHAVDTKPVGKVPAKVTSDSVTVVAAGEGATEDQAIKMALVKAAESALGVYVFQRSTITTDPQKGPTLESAVSETVSNGIVTSYKVLDRYNADQGLVGVTLEASVAQKAVESQVHDTDGAIMVNDALAKIGLIGAEQERQRQLLRLLKAMSGPTPEAFFRRAYSVEFAGYELKEIGPDRVDVDALVRISLNGVFWKSYYQIVSASGSMFGMTYDEGAFGTVKGEKQYADYMGIPSPYKVAAGLKTGLVSPLGLQVAVNNSKSSIMVWKNGFFNIPVKSSEEGCDSYATGLEFKRLPTSLRSCRAYSVAGKEDVQRAIQEGTNFVKAEGYFNPPEMWNKGVRPESAIVLRFPEDKPVKQMMPLVAMGSSIVMRVPVRVKDENELLQLPHRVQLSVKQLPQYNTVLLDWR
jgi:hypothetical protein